MNLLFKKTFQWISIKIRMITGINISKEPAARFTGASKILENQYGHLLSENSKQAVDGQHNPLPWFTYPAIEYLKQLDFSDKIMLEWGTGNSSLFFSKRVIILYSIEHNKGWFKKIKQKRITNHKIYKANEQDYATKPLQFKLKFDVILIDGIKREACGIAALELLTNDGMIILDNSDRHPDIAEKFRNAGLIEVDFHGFGPINNYTWTTSIFLKREFRINPLSFQPNIPIGGGH